MPRARPTLLPLTLVVALLATGCGSSDHSGTDASRTREEPSTTAPSPSATRRSSPATPAACEPARLAPARGPVTRAATDTLERATQLATRRGHRFVTSATVTVAGGLTARATLSGRTLGNGTSRATLRWRGAASLVLPDGELRIADNRIRSRSGVEPWRDLGSASGIALDVGRELHTHPFLLRPTGATRRRARTTVTATARAPDLRAYAGSERQGLATELLVGARSLRITTRIDGDRMARDSFVLVTQLPARLARQLGGRSVTVLGDTAYCALPANE